MAYKPGYNRPEGTHRIVADVDDALYADFLEACKDDDRTVASALRLLMRRYVKDNERKKKA